MPRPALLILLALTACSSLAPSPTPTVPPPTFTLAPTPTPTLTPSPTPLGCLSERGTLDTVELDSTKPAQEFLVYLPPCYVEKPEERYPVLYLLHGQTYTDEQWVHLGATVAADNLIHSGQAPPFILVFPDDRYWNLSAGAHFGERFIDLIIPYVDQNYRTIADRDHRALGGLSRGGGWAVHMLLTRYDLFGTIGLHSPVVFQDDAVVLQKLVKAVPATAWPRLWIDAGDRDGQLADIRRFEALLTTDAVPHEWRMYTGDHTDNYWHAHVVEYLQWYTAAFMAQPVATPVATPTP